MNKIRIYLAIVLIIFGLDALRAQDSGLLKASFLLHHGDSQTALNYLLQIGDNTNEKVSYLDLLGEAAFLVNDLDLAEKTFQSRLNFPDPDLAFFQLARIAFLQGDKAQGFEFLKKHLQSNQRLEYSAIVTDPAFEGLDRDREWIRFWSVDWYPESDQKIAEMKARYLEETLDLSYINDLLSFYPDEHTVLLESAYYLEKIGEKKQMSGILDRLLKLRLSSNELNKIIEILVSTGDLEQANQVISKSLSNSNYQPDLWMLRIRNLYELNRANEANQMADQLYRMGIESPDLLMSLAVSQKDQDLPAAIDLLDKVIAADPLSNQGLNLRAQYLNQAGQLARAIEDLNQSLDINASQPDVYFLRAQIRYDSGDREGACYDWNKALRYGHRKALDRLYKYCDY